MSSDRASGSRPVKRRKVGHETRGSVDARDEVDCVIEQSFPASDPPSWTLSAARPDEPVERVPSSLISKRALEQQLRALCGQ